MPTTGSAFILFGPLLVNYHAAKLKRQLLYLREAHGTAQEADALYALYTDLDPRFKVIGFAVTWVRNTSTRARTSLW